MAEAGAEGADLSEPDKTPDFPYPLSGGFAGRLLMNLVYTNQSSKKFLSTTWQFCSVREF